MDEPEDVLPPSLPHITTMPVYGGWMALCSEHGASGITWSSEQWAGFAAMGHAAAFHGS